MTAALVVAATSPIIPAVLAVLVRAGIRLPTRAPRASLAAHIVAAHLDDYSWREEQLLDVRLRAALVTTRQLHVVAQRWNCDTAALAAVYGPRPPAPRQGPGVPRIAAWWAPAPSVVIGRPPLATRPVAGATLTGVAA